MDTLSRARPPAVPAYLLDLLRPLHQLVPLGDCSSVATHPKAGVRASAKTKTRDRRFRGLCRNRRHFRRSSMTQKPSRRNGGGATARIHSTIQESLAQQRLLWERCPELGVASGPYAGASSGMRPLPAVGGPFVFPAAPGLFLGPGSWEALGEAGTPNNTFTVGSEACGPGP